MQLFISTSFFLLQLCCLLIAVNSAELPCEPACQNGECTAYHGELSCQCSGNWSGPACDMFVCETDNPCLNNGLCSVASSNSSHYTCSCPLGYTGDHCQYMVPRGQKNNCTRNPCGSHGVCYINTQKDSTFFCDCDQGHFGPTCNYTTNPCETETCGGHGRCDVVPDVEGNPFGYCTCDEYYGFSGALFDQCKIFKPFNYCAEGFCKNEPDGCQILGRNEYKCTCSPDYQGKNCETPFDVCSDQNRCLNGGHCIPDGHYFTCSCPPNYTGDRCQTLNEDPCLGKVCLNEGNCVVEQSNGTNASTARCECPCGYSGEQCEISPLNRVARSDPCTPNPCDKGGVCAHKDTAPWFNCQCKPGFTGPLCDKVDHCSKLPLKGGAAHCKECVNSRDSFHCVCENGWGGKLCDKDIDECFNNPCLQGQKCINRKGTFSCI